MIYLFVLVAVCTFLAHIIDVRTYEYDSLYVGIKSDGDSKIYFFLIIIGLILFAGLRSRYNDTFTYMYTFSSLDVTEIGWADIFQPYGGYDIFQKIIKSYISENPQMIIFMSSLVCVALYMNFIVKHAESFCESLFLFLIADYTFLMAGIKQAIAIAIALYAVDCYMKKYYFRAILLLAIAMTFHPYIICLFCIIFLKDKVWDWKTLLVMLLFLILFLNLDNLFSLLSLIGRDYSMESFDSYTINPFRVVVLSVPVLFSFYFRNVIRSENDEWLNLGINLQVISFVFIFLGLFFKPIYLGRMSSYFTIISMVTIPKMLKVSISESYYGPLFKLCYYGLFGIYYVLDMTKLGTISIFGDVFEHVDIWSIFASVTSVVR